jgi:hypothetical protein
MIRGWMCAFALLIGSVTSLPAQTVGTELINAVPPAMKFSDVLLDDTGKPLTGTVGVTFSLYKDEQGGAPLWVETQNVLPDKLGHYSVMLGSASSQGLPADLFTAGEPRWIGVKPEGQTEQPRVMLASVPYAMKAGDAATVGGLPASAFMLAPLPSSSSSVAASSGPSTQAILPALSGTGTTDFLPIWTNSTTLGSSVLFQLGSGSTVKVGINTTTPASTLDVNGAGIIRGLFKLPATGTATATTGKNSQAEDFIASAFSSTTHAAVNQTFQWQAEPAGNNTASPSGTLNLLFGSGTSAPAETGLKLSNKGLFTFAAGQKFPGTGTITGVTAGTDLAGGGTSGNVTLSLDTTKVPRLAAANTFTANQKINGALTATSFSGNGASVTNVNAALLGGLGVNAFAQLGANNTFTGTQNIQNLVFVGSFNSFLNGQLNVGSASIDLSGFAAGGFNSALGSGGSGTDGLQSYGGTGDFTTQSGNTGGRGIFAEGGPGDTGGVGVYGYGGGGLQVDGSGGFFRGGNNSFNAGDGIDAVPGSGYAGNFSGNLNVTGAIFAGVKDFRIDHPLDPTNKYLVHSSVESSEMMNIYSGNVTTDAGGEAVVELPQWFEALNTDFRYQLTVIGQFAQAIVAREIQSHQFTIRTNSAHVKVSWQVTAVRQDAYAKAHPLLVEEVKDARLRGFYIHPELYGAAQERQVEWARHPELMKRMKEQRDGHHAVQPVAQVQTVQTSK